MPDGPGFVHERRSAGCGLENVRPEPVSGDRALIIGGGSLDGRPVLGADQDLIPHPVRDGLLAERRPLQEFGDESRERRLATDDVDGPSQFDNVLLFHRPARYTNQFVSVNNAVCVTGHKTACIVIPMSAYAKKKARKLKPRMARKPSSKRIPRIWPDGKTLGQRVLEAMDYHSSVIGAPYRQTDLIKDLSRELGLSSEEETSKMQQSVSAIINKQSKSDHTQLIAEICGVRWRWLAKAQGSMIAE